MRKRRRLERKAIALARILLALDDAARERDSRRARTLRIALGSSR